MGTLESLARYINNPKIEVKLYYAHTYKQKTISAFKLLLSLLIITLIVSVPLSGINAIANRLITNPPEYILTNSYLKQIYGNYYLIYPLIIGPICEESIFRLPLNLNKKYLIISALIGMIHCFHTPDFSIYTFLEIAYILILLYVSSLNKAKRSKLRSKYFNYIFYISILIFTLLHLSTFSSITPENVIICLIRITPIFILAYFLSYTRCTIGFKYAVLVHISYNAIVTLI